jgi:hypothetical protein
MLEGDHYQILVPGVGTALRNPEQVATGLRWNSPIFLGRKTRDDLESRLFAIHHS